MDMKAQLNIAKNNAENNAENNGVNAADQT
jgi:hypothetical protein